MGRYAGATYVQSPFYSPGRPSWVTSQGIMWIIIHGTASGTGYPASSTANDFATSRGASTHYIVGYDGSVFQCVDENDTAWGNGPVSGPSGTSVQGGGSSTRQHDSFWDTVAKGDCNACTISIEHSKSTDNLSPLSPVQQAASFALIRDILTRWGKFIPVQLATEKGGITGHYSMDPVNRSFCPGPYPWAELLKSLGGPATGGTGTGGTPTGGTGTGGTPTGGTGVVATGGTIVGATQTYSPLLAQVHQTITANQGFIAIALAMDEIEQLPGWIDLTDQYNVGLGITVPDPVGLMRSVGATVADNAAPVLVRAGIISAGVLILILLLLKLIDDSGLTGDVAGMLMA
jgi:hypothetical protein